MKMRRTVKKIAKKYKLLAKLKDQDDLIEATLGFRPATRRDRDRFFTDITKRD